MTTDETTVDENQVRAEHIREVHVPRHWAYLSGVILGGLLLMIALVAVLGASAS